MQHPLFWARPLPGWGDWHLPAFWFREGYIGLDAVGLIGVAIGLTAGAIMLTALYNATHGSILVVALWHGSWNWVASSGGYGGVALKGSVNTGFVTSEMPAGFAAKLAAQPPLPDGCAF